MQRLASPHLGEPCPAIGANPRLLNLCTIHPQA